MDQLDKAFELVFLITGPSAVVFSAVSVVRTRTFILRSAEVPGEVIRLERTKSDGQFASYDYAPVFTFTVADGTSYTVTSQVSSSPPGFSVGDSVRVRYDPANPQDARIHTFFQTWGIAVIFGLIGVGFTAYGCKLFGLPDW